MGDTASSIHYSIRIPRELDSELKAACEKIKRKSVFGPTPNQFLLEMVRKGLDQFAKAA